MTEEEEKDSAAASAKNDVDNCACQFFFVEFWLIIQLKFL